MKIRNNGGVLGPKSNTSTTAASGVWSAQEIYQNQRDGTWPTAVDPSGDINYNQTSLLLHGDGTNGTQNNTFLDGSTNAFTITRNGNTTQGTFSPFSREEGYWSNYLDGSSTVYFAAGTSLTLGTGDFTIEFWIYTDSFSNSSGRISWGSGGMGNYIDSSGYFTYTAHASSVKLTATVACALNQWNHVALCRSNATTTIYINGKSAGSTSDTNNWGTGSGYLTVGGGATTGDFGKGYYSNVRIVKGAAVYTSNFTPSTAPLTAISGTSLLTCQSNRYKDNSSGAISATTYGSPSVQVFSPFGGTTAYSAATNGGSGYFDGSGDYLSATLTGQAPGTSAFTYECWVYSDLSQTFGLMNTRSGDTSDGFDSSIGTDGSGGCSYTGTAFLTYSAGTIKKNSWTHIAIVFDGNTTWNLYVNGVSVASRTASQNFTSTTFNIGVTALAGNPAKGYISNFRYTKSAVYTGTFTPPTAPFTTITNTQFLCNFTNIGIVDNTQSINLETVGNASISTTQKKFGTASMYFDASSSYLKCPSNPNVAFGTGDFTIEYWMYSNDVSSSTQKGIFQTSDTAGGLKTSYTTGILMGQGYSGGNLSGAIRAIINNTEIGSSVAVLTTGVWYHIALVRVSGVVTIYVNGNSVASGTISSSIDGTNLAVGGYYNTSYTFNGYIDDFRITKGVARYLYNFIPPTKPYPNYGTIPSTPGTDSYFGSTSLLLHGDGSSGTQNQTFLDSSTNAFTITRNGNTTQGTFTPFSRAEGYWSNYFNGSSDLSVASNTAFAVGTGDFTWEAWLYPLSWATASPIFTVYKTNSGGLWIGKNNSNFVLRAAGVSDQLTTNLPAINQWTHIAVVRSGSTATIYYNGSSVASGTVTYNFAQEQANLGSDGAGSYFTGYISNFRLVKGTAVYTSNFTPSTTPLTSITNTALLTCQSNRFKDNSTNAFAITTSGSPQVQTFIPFEPTAAYSAATNGGSAYFDGTGDYLSSSVSAIGTGDFTIEYWSYLNVLNGASQPGYFQISDTAGGLKTTYTTGVLALDNTTLYVNVGGTTIATSHTLVKYQWFHTAIVRSSGTVSVYVNGVLVSTPASITTNLSGTYLAIGGYYNTSYLIPGGYISNFRVLVGTALYTSAFTPPTAPLTAVSNTKFLCNFTNAGVIDSTASNVLETVGTAQASAVQYKFGTGSMYFDGSGDWLVSPANPNLVLGTGDFTIEAWIYIASPSDSPVFESRSAGLGTDGFTLTAFSSTVIRIFTSSTLISATVANYSSTWTHVAVVRINGTTKLYVNGVAGGTTTSLGNLTNNTVVIGGGRYGGGGDTSITTSLNGYIDDFRITKGVCRYPYNFQPPTAAYPDY